MNNTHNGKCGFSLVPDLVRRRVQQMEHFVPFAHVYERAPKDVTLSPAVAGITVSDVDEYGFTLTADLDVVSEYSGTYTVVMD